MTLIGRTFGAAGPGKCFPVRRITPFNAVCHNLVFINFYHHGQAYTEGEHRNWLESAEFTDIQRHAMPGGYGLMTALKA